ncbi:MAG: hypothetical protein HY911_07965 [Desulfobacterales bacterium]|nr:hypothetical protein [Desulfobacterales bacterium]
MKTAGARIVTLDAKLALPLLPETIQRSRLQPIIEQLLTHKVLSVVAGAGYGKTTFVAQACRRLGVATVWYRLDPSDRDVITFIQYLVAGIARHYPGFGGETLRRIQAAQTVPSEQRAILTVLLNEMEQRITAPLVIVLDDFHLVQASPAIQSAMALLLENLGPSIHLVIVGRSAPELRLSRLVAARQALQLRERELAFNLSETAALCREIFQLPLSQGQLELLASRTAGWVTGLILFNYMLKDHDPGPLTEQLQGLHGGQAAVFDYLQENIYPLFSAETAGFLLRTAILSRLEVDFCNRLLEIQNAGAILRQLEAKHLFTFALDGRKQSFHYHQLFKDFLRTKLVREMDPATLAALHARAARLWAAAGAPEEAIGHLLGAGLHGEACALLASRGRSWIKDGRLHFFLSCLQQIPETLLAQAPWLLYLNGRALQLSGKASEAARIFGRAHAVFQAQADDKGMALTLNRLATHYYVIGDHAAAEIKFKLLLDRIRGRPRLYVDALGHLIFIAAHAGRLEEADRYYAAALEVLDSQVETDLHAWIYVNFGFRHFRAGDLAQAKALGQKANRISLQLGLPHLLTLGYHLVSVAEYYLGRFESALETALRGVRTGEENGFIETAHALNWNHAAICAAALGHFEDAIAYGRNGLRVCKELNSLWSEVWAHRALAEAYLKAGDSALAEQSARTALQAVAPLAMPFDRAMMQAGLAAVLIEKGSLDEALALLTEAVPALEGFVLYLSGVHLLLARCHQMRGEAAAALEHLGAALGLGRTCRHEHWLTPERSWVVPLLVDLYGHREALRTYIEKLIRDFGHETLVTLRQIQSHEKGACRPAGGILGALKKQPPPELRIVCFGRFRLWRGSVELPAEQWPGEKPKLLFKLLCVQYARGFLPKEAILEALWPDEDPRVTRNRLNVALTKLRHILEPELTRGLASRYLVRQGDAYRLALGPGGSLDIALFDQALTAAQQERDEEQMLEHYLRAEAVYAGPLLAEDPYVEWCTGLRDQYQAKYLDILGHIISGYRREEHWVKCIDYARKYLAVDPYVEEMYQALMMFHHAAGHRSMVIKTYEMCKARIEKELEVVLSEETTELFQQLTVM